MESYPGLSNFFVVSVNTTPLLSPRSPELTVFSGRTWVLFCCCSVTKSCPTLCVTHGLQHARLPCPSLSPSPGVCSNSCTLSQWCHPTISSSVIPFSCLQSFPASGSFLVSQLFASRGQSIGASASAPFLPMNIQDWFPWGWCPHGNGEFQESPDVCRLEPHGPHHRSSRSVFIQDQLGPLISKDDETLGGSSLRKAVP